MTGITVKILWEKYLQGTATLAELEQLRSYFSQPEYRAVLDGLLQDAFTDPRNIEKGDHDVDEMVSSLMLKLKEENSRQAVVRRMTVKRWIWVAASLFLFAVGGLYLWRNKAPQPAQSNTTIAAKEDLPPGDNGAILTLSDGRQVVLDSLGNGLVAHQNGSDVMMENGRLSYDPKEAGRREPAYNTMSTPRGRQFQMSLPDGSKVWLNAASSIRFPVAFTGPERKVEITGEVYIDVKKNAARPFVVQGSDFVLLVLGTGFNINSYADNGALKATLVEGAVKMRLASDSNGVLLSPGEQWIYNAKTGKPKVIRSADLNHVLAWKEKRFSFNGNFRSIMNELARWYDVELNYEGNIPDKELEGGFTREIELQKVLEILKVVAGVEFELNGKLLTIRASK
ncbi:FecR family protein [Pseudoflavitalea rhizosphaerae]|uniref:FecR family protein n=1 Tax=Pseudoflavitalea rhizosphaerae TaxID=1884793 RepID=UPI000F8C6C9A|nr:FecR family protein [Pseudoflavitalea rhizosphaerae]